MQKVLKKKFEKQWQLFDLTHEEVTTHRDYACKKHNKIYKNIIKI